MSSLGLMRHGVIAPGVKEAKDQVGLGYLRRQPDQLLRGGRGGRERGRGEVGKYQFHHSMLGMQVNIAIIIKVCILYA